MAISRKWTSVEANTAGPTITFAVPATFSAVNGDVLVVIIGWGFTSGSVSAPTSSGVTWALQTSKFDATVGWGGIFTGVVSTTQAAGTTYIFTASSTHFLNGTMPCYSGVDTAAVIDLAFTTQAGSAANVTQSATLVRTGDYVVTFSTTVNSTTYTPPTGFGVILNDGGNSIVMSDKLFASSGGTGNFVTAWTPSDNFISVAIALAGTSTASPKSNRLRQYLRR